MAIKRKDYRPQAAKTKERPPGAGTIPALKLRSERGLYESGCSKIFKNFIFWFDDVAFDAFIDR